MRRIVLSVDFNSKNQINIGIILYKCINILFYNDMIEV